MHSCRFLTDDNVVDELASTFMGLYSLDVDSPHTAAIERALHDPDHFVMKPQREGGGLHVRTAS